jgi:hypothetical protein
MNLKVPLPEMVTHATFGWPFPPWNRYHCLTLRPQFRKVFHLDVRLDQDMAAAMEDAFYNRWTMVKTDLHSAGALLNPYLLHDKELADDSNSLTACKRVLRKLCSPETYPDVVQDFLAFRHK